MLDEATANVDPEADAVCTDVVMGLPETVVFICHKLAVRTGRGGAGGTSAQLADAPASVAHDDRTPGCSRPQWCPTQNIARFDQVVVMSAGQVVEAGPPAALLAARDSALSRLVSSSARGRGAQ